MKCILELPSVLHEKDAIYFKFKSHSGNIDQYRPTHWERVLGTFAIEISAIGSHTPARLAPSTTNINK